MNLSRRVLDLEKSQPAAGGPLFIFRKIVRADRPEEPVGRADASGVAFRRGASESEADFEVRIRAELTTAFPGKAVQRVVMEANDGKA